MSREIDILAIDSKILLEFEEELLRVPEYKVKLKDLQNALTIINISINVKNNLIKTVENLEKNICDIQTQVNKNFYIIETAKLIRDYNIILKTPIRVSFVGKIIKNDKAKQVIIKEYLDVAKKYTDIYTKIDEKMTNVTCHNIECLNKKNFDIIDNNIYVCLDCGVQQEVFFHTSSYKDIDRVNISVKYKYDRKVHFRDCINQYQGKQNSTIDQKIYDELEDQFDKHHLLIGNSSTKKEIRFSKINKDHIQLFLKELEYTKHYENVNLIFYNLTGNKPDDISHLEAALLNDFDALTDTYDLTYKNKIERKNFINTQHVLYHLLRKHKHRCDKSDFTVLKTIDRKSFHDKISSHCFGILGWTYTPYI
jgi:hypothetical protein